MKHPRKYAFPWHDTVAHLFKYPAVSVAFLSDLRNLEKDLPAFQSRSDRKLPEAESFRHDIFPKGSIVQLCPTRTKRFDFLQPQKTHLSMPIPSMGIPFHAVFCDKPDFFHRMFLCTALFTDAQRFDFSHANPLAQSMQRVSACNIPIPCSVISQAPPLLAIHAFMATRNTRESMTRQTAH